MTDLLYEQLKEGSENLFRDNEKNQLYKFIKLISMERNLFLTQLNNYYSYNNNLHCDIEVRGLKLKIDI